MSIKLKEQGRESPEKIWRDYFTGVEREKQSRGERIVAPTPERLKDVVKQIWQNIFQKGKKGKTVPTEDPRQLKLPIELEPYDITRMKKIQPLVPGLTPKERRKKYLADFGRPPFYIDTRKWLTDNFTGDVYVGPDLTQWGFKLRDQSGLPIQKIRPWERIKHHWIFQDNLESNMRAWNYAMARKIGLIEPSKTDKELEKAARERETRPVY